MIVCPSWVESLPCSQWKKVVTHETQHQTDNESQIVRAPQIRMRICGEKQELGPQREKGSVLKGLLSREDVLHDDDGFSAVHSRHLFLHTPCWDMELSVPFWYFLYPTPGIFFSRVEVNGSFFSPCFKNYYFSFAKGK